MMAAMKMSGGGKAETYAKRYLISGRVQGVGFRYFVEREARALGLVGTVRNLDDGRVEVEALGTAAELADLEGALWKGPRLSDVRGVESGEIALSRFESYLSIMSGQDMFK